MALTNPIPNVSYEFDLAARYLRGETAWQDAAVTLERQSAYGCFLAAEICLDMVKFTDSPDIRQKLFFGAARMYQKVSSPFWFDRDYQYSANLRASLRLAQMPAYIAVYNQGMMPTMKQISVMYKKIIDQSAVVSHDFGDLERKYEQSHVKGTISEMAVLALGQRFALRRLKDNSWLPLQSLLSEDRASSVGQEPWDINIFTQLDQDEPVIPTYKLQVKSSLRPDDTPTNEVSLINLNFKKEARFVGSRVLGACKIEQEKGSAILSNELDHRTNNLLNNLD